MIWKKKRDWENDYDEYYADRARPEARERVPLWIHGVLLLVMAVLFVGLVWAVGGRTMAEKTLKLIATPVGLIWLVLGLFTYFSLIRRLPGPALTGLVLWALLTISGNYFFKQWLVARFERDYYTWTQPPNDQPFDVIVVLGGGTNSTLNGRPQLTRSGDRVMTAARLYHAGLTPKIITSGERYNRTSPEDLDPADEARQILIECGVPSDVVLKLKGRNTSEEIANLKQWIDLRFGSADDVSRSGRSLKIGVISSAWHLPRVERLCQAQGIDVELVPSNFMSGPFAPDPSMVVPSASNLESVGQLIHEWMGMLIGR